MTMSVSLRVVFELLLHLPLCREVGLDVWCGPVECQRIVHDLAGLDEVTWLSMACHRTVCKFG
jgi:hypothetical protein